MQQDSIQSQLDIYKKQKSQYEKLAKSIQDDKNYFSETAIAVVRSSSAMLPAGTSSSTCLLYTS